MASGPTFENDIDFCPECGSILPLPGMTDKVTCKTCRYEASITDFDGLEIKTKVVFNKRETKTAGLTADDFAGATVDKKCPKCGNDGMTYATRQTRGADEGQTVFYTCPKCKFQETEYS